MARQVAFDLLAALLLALPAAARAGDIPDPPAFNVNLVTPNADYRVSSVSSLGSPHYFPTLKTISAALALDNATTPIFGMPNGYHAGYIGRGFRQPYFSSGDRLVQFYDCTTDDEDDADCDNGFASLGRILMPVSVYDTASNSCIRGILGHELFHHIEFAYADAAGDSGCGGFYGNTACEGQARALQDKIYLDLDLDPEASCVAPYLGQVDNFLASPNQNLWNSSYDAALWWTYLSEQYGTVAVEPHRGIDFFVRWWDNAEAAGAYPDALAITDETIRELRPEHHVKAAFHDFIVANIAKDLDLTGSSAAFRNRYSYRDEEPLFFYDNAMHYGEVPRNSVIVPADGTREVAYSVTNYGASYTEWDLSNCSNGSRIRFETDPDVNILGNRYYTITGLLAVRGDDPGRPVHFYKNRSTGWTQELVQPFDRYDRLVSVVAGWSSFSFGTLRVTCDPQPPSPQLPLLSEIHPVTPGPPERLSLGEIPVDVHDPGAPRDPGLRALGADAFAVEVGGKRASVLAALRRDDHYDLQVEFPTQPDEGDYPLSVRVGDRTTTIADAVRYGEVVPEVLLAVDTSTSMLLPTLGSRLDAAKRAAGLLYFPLPRPVRFGVIEHFGNGSEPGDDAFVRAPLGLLDAAHLARVENTIGALTSGAGRGTALGDALRVAVAEFALRGEARQPRHVVLVCDGSEGDADRWEDVRTAVLAAGIRVHTIAFGPVADQPLLERIARESGGHYRYVDVGAAVDEADLGHVFAGLADAIAERTRVAQNETITVDGGRTESVWVRVGQLHTPGSLGGTFHLGLVAPGAGREVIASVRVFDPSGVERIDGVDGTATHVRNRFFSLVDRTQLGEWRVEITTVAGAPTTPFSLVASVDDAGASRVRAAVSRDGADPASSVELLTGDIVRVQIALLLPAIQAAREAGRRASVRHPDGSIQEIALNDDGEHGDAIAEDGVWSGTYRRTTLAAPTGYPDSASQPGTRGTYTIVFVGSRFNTPDAGAPKGMESLSFSYARLDASVLSTGSLADADLDQMPDRYEQRNGCLVSGSNDGSLDADGDTRANLLEYQDGTDPCDADQDDGGETDDSERRAGRNPADPDDDALCPIEIAQVESPEQEHEETPAALANALRLRFSTCARNTTVEVQRGTSAAGPFLNVAMLDGSVRGVHLDPGLVPGTTYWYRLLARNATAVGPATAPFSGRAKSDPERPLGSVRIADGRPRASGATLPLTLALYNKPMAGTQIQVRVGDAPAGPWQPFQREVEVAAPAVAAPRDLVVSVVLRDAEQGESQPLVDDIRVYPVGALGAAVARVVAPGTGVPLAGVWASLVEAETEATAVTGSDGTAVLPALKPGTYTVAFDVPGHATTYRNVTIAAGTTTDLGTVALDTRADALFLDGFEASP